MGQEGLLFIKIYMENPNIVVVDNGTGYTKVGYAGNFEPSYILPTTIAEKA